jgi:hypothetical protein
MAVDDFHRLIISGPTPDLRALRAGLVTDLVRVIEGEEYKERLPFSFAGLIALAPAAKNWAPEGALEPYDIRVWPIVRRSSRTSDIRYQLHTRNEELLPFVRELSRAFTRLTFRMSMLQLDDSEVYGFLVRNGKVRKWNVPGERRDVHWDRARKKFNLVGDDVYDDDDATLYAEDGMQDEALDHWAPAYRLGAGARRRDWWNRPATRDFMEQRELDLVQASEIAAEFDREERRQRRRRKKGLTSAAAAAGAPPSRLPHVVEQTRENLDAEARLKRRRKKEESAP